LGRIAHRTRTKDPKAANYQQRTISVEAFWPERSYRGYRRAIEEFDEQD
jgi:hypothetical protein